VLRAGKVIFKEGETGEEFFVILKGLVSVTSAHNGNTVQIATLQPGDFFGELALIETGAVRRATCVCKEECHLAVLHKRVFAKCVPITHGSKRYLHIMVLYIAYHSWGTVRETNHC
jgi:CRP-like cAMP-binding protein